MPAGSYFVIACADAQRAVKERSEANNCRTAPGEVAVPVSSPPIVPPPPPYATRPDPAPAPVTRRLPQSSGETRAGVRRPP